MKKRLLGFIGALVLALVGTTLLVSFVSGAEERALAGEEIVEVFVAAETIERGTFGEDIADLLTVEKVPVKVQVANAVAELEELEGLVAEVDLLPGEQITFDRFVEPTEISRYARTVPAPDGFLEMTMSLSPERVVGGSLQPGDSVAIVGSFEPFDIPEINLPEGLELTLSTTEQLNDLLDLFFQENQFAADQTPNTTHVLAHKVLVTHVQEEELPQDILDGDGEAVGSTAIAPTGNLLVTVAVDAPTLERIVFTKEFGLVWLAAEPTDASEDGTTIVTRADVYGEDE